MAFTSFAFYLLTGICVAGYYLLPGKRRWIWLLAVSGVYYAAAGPFMLLFLLFSAATTWTGGRFAAGGKRAAVAIPLLLNFGVLGWLKYSNLLISTLNLIPGVNLPLVSLLLPLGISFYTFQSAGYLLDVYWGRTKPEEHFLKYLLFVAFYPQLMQGPIGRFGTLGPQLQKGQPFDILNIRRGLWRITWGIFKKMVIADNAALYVTRIFDGYNEVHGLGFQGVLLYSVQLYMDFSGGIDVAIGIAEMLGIHLDENFRQPYFAQSLTDFWHRWHITLGTWMKDYLFYPISLSGWMGSLRRVCRKCFGKEMGRAMPVGVANLIVFIAVGIWHGQQWHYIAYGIYNGLIIAVSGLLTGTFRRWKDALGIQDQMKWFQGFRMLRTFLIVNISWYLDRSGSIHQAWVMFKESFGSKLFSLTVIEPSDPSYCLLHFMPVVLGLIVVLVVSILKERKVDVSGTLAALPTPVLMAGMTAVLLICALFGNKDSGGFIYANF